MRRLTASLITLALILATFVTAPAATAEEPDPIAPASAHLYSCLQTAHSVSVLFVLDKSGSLKLPGKDPGGLRYDGLATALTDLSGIKRPDGERVDVEAAVAGFSDTYLPTSEVVPWQRINGEDSSEVIPAMVDQARKTLDPKGGTDFQRALEGGFSDFGIGSRVADCRIMFWFTDGEFSTAKGKDIDDHGPNVAGPVIEQARREICTPGSGVIDQLRSNGVVVLGIQLGPAAADLRRMSIGILGDTTCGTWPIPDGWAPGGYLQVDDASNLNGVFSQMNDLATGCTPTGDVGNQIDPGIGRIMVRIPRSGILTPVPETEEATLTSPGGGAVAFTVPGSQTSGGYLVESTHDAGHIGARVTLPPGSPAGRWEVAAPATGGNPTFCVWPDLTLAPDPDRSQLIAGEEGEIRTLLTRPDGTPTDLDVYRAIEPEVSITDPEGQPVPAETRIEGGAIVTRLTPGRTTPRLDIRVSVRLVTASGLRLAPLATSWAAPVSSDSFPSIQPADRLDLGTISRTGTGTAKLILTGARSGVATVCLAPGSTFSSPVENETNRLSLQEGCVELQPLERREVTVSFTPSSEAIGGGRSGVAVQLTSAAADGQQPLSTRFELPVSWYQTVPVDVATFGLLFVALVVLSVVMVWAAIWLAMYLTTRFNTDGLRHAAAEVEIGHFGIRPATQPGPAPGCPRSRPGQRDHFPRAETEPPENRQLITAPRPLKAGNPRRIKPPRSSLTLLARTPLVPGAAPRFLAQVPEGQLLEANSSPSSFHQGREVPVPAGLSLLIVVTTSVSAVAASPEKGPLRATLHLFTTDDTLSVADMDAAIRGMHWLGFVTKWQRQHRRSAPEPTDPGPAPGTGRPIHRR